MRSLALLCALFGAATKAGADMSNEQICAQVFAAQGSPSIAQWCPYSMTFVAEGAINKAATGDGLIDPTLPLFEDGTFTTVEACIAQNGGKTAEHWKIPKWTIHEVWTRTGSDGKEVMVFADNPMLHRWAYKCTFNDDHKLVQLDQYTTKQEIAILPKPPPIKKHFALVAGAAEKSVSLLPMACAFLAGLTVAAFGCGAYARVTTSSEKSSYTLLSS